MKKNTLPGSGFVTERNRVIIELVRNDGNERDLSMDERSCNTDLSGEKNENRNDCSHLHGDE